MSHLDALDISPGSAFDRRSGAGYRINPIAQRVLAELREGRRLGEIAADLIAEHPLNAQAIPEDLERFAARCRELGLPVEDERCAR